MDAGPGRLAALSLLVASSSCYDPSAGGPGDCGGVQFEDPVLVEEVSSVDAEFSPSLSSDLRTLYFGSNRPGGMGEYDIYVARRASAADRFGPPENLTAVNGALHEGGPSISADDLSLYYGSTEFGSLELFVIRRSRPQDPFDGVPELVDPPTRAVSADISADELTLYFTTDDPPGFGDFDLWTATRTRKEDDFGVPTRVDGVNTSLLDLAPSIAATGLQLYLQSDRYDLSMDVLVATRDTPGEDFGPPVPVVGVSEAGRGEFDPDLSGDGSILAVVLSRTDGIGQTDIYFAHRLCPTER